MYICICEQVTDKQIKHAIGQGASSMRDLRQQLGVASQCGQCGRCAKALLKEHATRPSALAVISESLTQLPVCFA